MGFKLATVVIRNKRTKKVKTVNAVDYPTIMASSGDWELVKEQFANKVASPEAKIEIKTEEPVTLVSGDGTEVEVNKAEEKVETEANESKVSKKKTSKKSTRGSGSVDS